MERPLREGEGTEGKRERETKRKKLGVGRGGEDRERQTRRGRDRETEEEEEKERERGREIFQSSQSFTNPHEGARYASKAILNVAVPASSDCSCMRDPKKDQQNHLLNPVQPTEQ